MKHLKCWEGIVFKFLEDPISREIEDAKIHKRLVAEGIDNVLGQIQRLDLWHAYLIEVSK